MTFRGRKARPLIRAVQEQHPKLKSAVLADLRLERRALGHHRPLGSRTSVLVELARVVYVSDAFGALLAYRIKATCQRRGIPVVPRIAHRVAVAWAQLSIGDPVIVRPGVRFLHGHVVIDGFAEIESGAEIRPFVTIGRRGSTLRSPKIERGVSIGTGAKVLGPITVGASARIGANAVVLHDVPSGAVMVGVPARRIR
jgi:serine O-acetyltransferase